MKAVLATGLFVLGIAVGAVIPPAAHPAAARRAQVSAPATLAARVRRLEDRAQIERLLMQYGRALDSRDFKAYAQLFATDGVWSGSTGTFKGPAAIQAAMEKAFGKRGSGAPVPRSFHLLTNAIIDVHGDHAVAVSKWTFVRVANNRLVIALAGDYDDTLVRERGHWRFLKRVAPSILAPPASR